MGKISLNEEVRPSSFLILSVEFIDTKVNDDVIRNWFEKEKELLLMRRNYYCRLIYSILETQKWIYKKKRKTLDEEGNLQSQQKLLERQQTNFRKI